MTNEEVVGKITKYFNLDDDHREALDLALYEEEHIKYLSMKGKRGDDIRYIAIRTWTRHNLA